MGLENLVEWTRSRSPSSREGTCPSRPPTLSTLSPAEEWACRHSTSSRTRANFVVVDVPGATRSNTHLAWNDIDTLSIHVQRATAAPGAASRLEYEEFDWYREIHVFARRGRDEGALHRARRGPHGSRSQASDTQQQTDSSPRSVVGLLLRATTPEIRSEAFVRAARQDAAHRHSIKGG